MQTALVTGAANCLWLRNRMTGRDSALSGGLIQGVCALLIRLRVRAKQGRLMLAAFCVLMVAGSAVHTLWTAKGLALKYCFGQQLACANVLDATRAYWTLAYNLGAVPGYLGAVLLAYLVILKKTWYPRWTVIVNPAVLILLSPLATAAPAPVGAILVGGWTVWPVKSIPIA